jgi:hypothetical protein
VTLVVDSSLPPGIRHLTVANCAQRTTTIAGLDMVHVDEPIASAPPMQRLDFALSVTGVDHVVVLADDVRATCAEIEAESGSPLKRVKEGDRGVQGFHRFGSVILEVVERRLVDPGHHVGRPTYWGFVITVGNLDEAVAHLGPDVIGAPKHAVQEGRRIATVRSGVGLGVPLAMMN